MKKWVFYMKQNDSGWIIDNLDIIRTDRGCKGHPKTIIALIHNKPISFIDPELLEQATCSRETSCGMVLAKCLKALEKSLNS
ncbi:TSCPD domain-containing protein [Candidatus Cloacimonadota bacterium]